MYRLSEPLASESDAAPAVRAVRVGPKPSRVAAAVWYETASTGPVQVEVFDVVGRRVAVLHSGMLPAGTHEATRPTLAPGVYAVRLQAPGGHAIMQAAVAR